MWGAPLHLVLQHKVQQGEIPGPHVVTTSPIIDGPGSQGHPFWPGTTLLAEASQAVSQVRTYAERGCQQIKVYSLLTQETLQAVGQAASQFGLRVTGHCPDVLTYEESIAAGMTCFEHLLNIAKGHEQQQGGFPSAHLNVSNEPRKQVHQVDLAAIRRLAQDMAEHQIWNCPTLTYFQPDEEAVSRLQSHPLLDYELPTTITRWRRGTGHRLSHREQEWRASARERNHLLRQMVGILHEEGAPLLLGTDTPNPYVYQGFSVHDELSNLVRAGLSPYEALRCGTSEGARFVQETALWGTVAVGKRADLLLTRSNPLKDITAVRDLEAVFVNGFALMRPDLDAFLTYRRAFVHDPHAFIPSTLSQSKGTGPTIQQGMWQEELHGGRAGDRRYYRHCLQQDGTSVLEEQTVGGEYTYVRGIQRAIERRSTRLWLERTGILRTAEIMIESLAGSEQYRLERSGQGDYRINWQEVDGHETRCLLNTPILFPTVQLTMTALPLLLEGQMKPAREMVLPTFGLERDGIHLYSLKIVPFTEENGKLMAQDGVLWQVTIDRPVAPVTFIYHLSADGTVVQVRSFGSTWIPGKLEK